MSDGGGGSPRPARAEPQHRTRAVRRRPGQPRLELVARHGEQVVPHHQTDRQIADRGEQLLVEPLEPVVHDGAGPGIGGLERGAVAGLVGIAHDRGRFRQREIAIGQGGNEALGMDRPIGRAGALFGRDLDLFDRRALLDRGEPRLQRTGRPGEIIELHDGTCSAAISSRMIRSTCLSVSASLRISASPFTRALIRPTVAGSACSPSRSRKTLIDLPPDPRPAITLWGERPATCGLKGKNNSCPNGEFFRCSMIPTTMPDSTSNNPSPTIGLFPATVIRGVSATSWETDSIRVRSIPQSTFIRCWSAIAASSVATLPARSPMPLTELWIMSAPAEIAITESAVARP